MHNIRSKARHQAWQGGSGSGLLQHRNSTGAAPDPSLPPLRRDAPLSADAIDLENLCLDAQQKSAPASEGVISVEQAGGKRIAKKHYTLWGQIKATIFASWLTIGLLPFVPAGFAVNYTHRSAVTVFCVNFIALVPSVVLLGYGVDELTLRVGDKLGALLNITFSNAAQLISSILLLKSRQISVLRRSLLGSILFNLLFMTGLCFLLGGYDRLEQYFNATLAQTMSMLLLLAVLSLVIPTASHLLTNTPPQGILIQSRGVSVIILVSYLLWLIFSNYTNREQFDLKAQPAQPAKLRRRKIKAGSVARGIVTMGAGAASQGLGPLVKDAPPYELGDEDNDATAEPQMAVAGFSLTILFATVLLAFNTEFATNSISGLLDQAGLSESFVGLVILPILNFDPGPLVLARQDKMSVSIVLTLERCLQSALMINPFIVLLAWWMGVGEMSLQFDGFTVTELFAAIIIVTYVIQEGKSNWLTGALLLKIFIIVAVAAWYVPAES